MNGKDQPQDWRPSASLSMLQLRARVLQFIRNFFAQRNVLEVETPILGSSTNPDPNIDSFATSYVGPQAAFGRDMFLQTSPEFAMKRLLSAGSGPIYQICKSFRQGEWGALHNPEFTILEWYRPGFDIRALTAEIEALLLGLFASMPPGNERKFETTQFITYRDAFLDAVGIDPLQASDEQLMQCVKHQDVDVRGLDCGERDAWLDVLMSHCVQPRLGRQRLTFVTDYPSSQAALARINPANGVTALRFELFIEGVELANGFHELGDATEQLRRFRRDLALRERCNKQLPPVDDYLLQALAHEFPDCAGVAIGLDRVIMMLARAKNLSEVVAFPMGRI